MKFRIEQVAFCPKDPVAAHELLAEMGIGDWINDHVKAEGFVHSAIGENEADLAFNYSALGGNELEILHYTSGENWMQGLEGRVSHIGMHCENEELAWWRKFFEFRGINVAQEVFTKSHTNPAIAGKRTYNYVIFDTREILGVDVKFIVRKDVK